MLFITGQKLLSKTYNNTCTTVDAYNTTREDGENETFRKGWERLERTSSQRCVTVQHCPTEQYKYYSMPISSSPCRCVTCLCQWRREIVRQYVNLCVQDTEGEGNGRVCVVMLVCRKGRRSTVWPLEIPHLEITYGLKKIVYLVPLNLNLFLHLRLTVYTFACTTVCMQFKPCHLLNSVTPKMSV